MYKCLKKTMLALQKLHVKQGRQKRAPHLRKHQRYTLKIHAQQRSAEFSILQQYLSSKSMALSGDHSRVLNGDFLRYNFHRISLKKSFFLFVITVNRFIFQINMDPTFKKFEDDVRAVGLVYFSNYYLIRSEKL